MNIDKVINEYEKVSMSNDQILKALDGQTKIIAYTDLEKFNNIDDVLKPYGNVVLLYQTKNSKFGHWTCLWKRDNTIYFFDSYGMAPDEEIQFAPYLQKANDAFILTKLLRNSGYQISVNKIPFQKRYKGIEPNTCGRHVIVRLKMKHLNHDEYARFMASSHMNADKLVSMMTFIL